MYCQTIGLLNHNHIIIYPFTVHLKLEVKIVYFGPKKHLKS